MTFTMCRPRLNVSRAAADIVMTAHLTAFLKACLDMSGRRTLDLFRGQTMR
jgi:hypothetical protein